VGTVSERTQSALKTVEKWCLKEGLTVNPGKTSVVPFTWKRDLKDLKELFLFGKKLQIKGQV